MKLGISLSVIVGLFLTLAMLFGAGWDRPPVSSKQQGYRGTGMVDVQNPRAVATKVAAQPVPAAQPAAPGDGPPASTVFKNVQVLGDLSVGEFTRTMVAITEWVSPKEGCNYCHVDGNLADDGVYTKVVARRMFQMTQHINADWKNHVGGTGVTCYTCHRGNPVPANVWFADAGRKSAKGFTNHNIGQNAPAKNAGLSSMNVDPFSPYLQKQPGPIRVAAQTALPMQPGVSIQATEGTYALMIHMSEALGVNCTACHNSRNFSSWEQGNAQRVTAYHGIQMARDLNVAYLDPLQPTYPPHRLGPTGDAAKLNCATCHQGLNKPLGGAAMAKDYPALTAAPKKQ